MSRRLVLFFLAAVMLFSLPVSAEVDEMRSEEESDMEDAGTEKSPEDTREAVTSYRFLFAAFKTLYRTGNRSDMDGSGGKVGGTVNNMLKKMDPFWPFVRLWTRGKWLRRLENHTIFLRESAFNGTQASDIYVKGDNAYEHPSNDEATGDVIRIIAKAVQSANRNYGVKESLVIAQVILETGWLHTPKTVNDEGHTLVGSNNVLSMNYTPELIVEGTKWSKYRTHEGFRVGHYDSSGSKVYVMDEMKTYRSMEDCIEDYIAVLVSYHPECRNNKDLEAYRTFLEGYTEGSGIFDTVRRIINDYGLEKFDR